MSTHAVWLAAYLLGLAGWIALAGLTSPKRNVGRFTAQLCIAIAWPLSTVAVLCIMAFGGARDRL